MMHRQCSQLTHLLDDLLDISRISRGTISLKRQVISLAPILDDAYNTLSGDALAKQIKLSIVNVPAEVCVDADEARLMQVLVNLLHNAIRYTPSGGSVAIKASVEAGKVCIRVEDNGLGIGTQDLGKVFDLFVQLDNPAGPANKGLGLGLALVNELVQLHGGTVDVHSEGLGKGCIFDVQLPLAATRLVQDTKSAALPAPPATKATRILDVLITDDNLDSITALGRLLERRHHRVRLATSGAAALQACQKKTPDVLLLDIGLQDMSGLEVACQIRQQHAETALLLIATTGYGRAEDQARSKQAGFDHHLTKPIDLAQLHSLMDEFRNSLASS